MNQSAPQREERELPWRSTAAWMLLSKQVRDRRAIDGDLADAQADDFRHAGAGIVHHAEWCVIPPGCAWRAPRVAIAPFERVIEFGLVSGLSGAIMSHAAGMVMRGSGPNLLGELMRLSFGHWFPYPN
ncbi:hypothetical protein [Mesorhizobium sp. M0130]|uniref:hypothetical protein n=1 Tax=Mesorhizobium sp. M0130 TaxID=2956887 RepID=UPI00333A7DFA